MAQHQSEGSPSSRLLGKKETSDCENTSGLFPELSVGSTRLQVIVPGTCLLKGFFAQPLHNEHPRAHSCKLAYSKTPHIQVVLDRGDQAYPEEPPAENELSRQVRRLFGLNETPT